MKNIFLLLMAVYTIGISSEFSAMQEACVNKIAEACYELGLVYEKGLGTDKNTTKAKAYYIDACQQGYDKACNTSEILFTNQ